MNQDGGNNDKSRKEGWVALGVLVRLFLSPWRYNGLSLDHPPSMQLSSPLNYEESVILAMSKEEE